MAIRNDGVGANSSVWSPAVVLKKNKVMDVTIRSSSLNVLSDYVLGGSAVRYGGCAVTKGTTEGEVTVATSGITTEVFGITASSVQDLEPANYREAPYESTVHTGQPVGIIQGNGEVSIRRFDGTVAPGDRMVVGVSGYLKNRSTSAETVVGIASTSGVGNIGDPTATGADTPIRIALKLPAKGNNI